MRVKVKAFGCKLTQCEAGTIERELAFAGHNVVLKPPFDAVIVCGCTVTMRADYKVRQYIRRVQRDYGVERIILSGCSAVSYDEDLICAMGVEKTFDSNDSIAIADYLGRDAISTDFTSTFHGRTRGFVKIQDGCDQFCSYCIVPLVRGRERSVAPQAILERIDELKAAGVKEAVLTGVHDGRYNSNGLDLAGLIRLILDRTRIERLRLSSVECNMITEDLKELLAHEPRVAKHLHVPLQSGSDSVLRRMNRKYSASEYAEVVRNLAERVEDIGIGADVIVGFPGEIDDEFTETYKLIKSLPLSYLHVFRYSPRPGTKAAEMTHSVHPETARERMEALKALHEQLREKFASSQLGKVRDVIIERVADGVGTGWTDNYLRIEVPIEKQSKGKIELLKLISYNNGITYCQKISST
jgi:threonylcarbamoyladenosine tRNA methylthiotransferase MtaB